MKNANIVVWGVLLCGLVVTGCNEVLGNDPPTLRSNVGDGGSGGRGGAGGTAGAEPATCAVEIVSPSAKATVGGDPVTLQWQGGSAPYSLEISLDEKFVDGVKTFGPINDTHYDLEIVRGGTIYWRVRSNNDCGSGENTATSSFTVSSKPFELRKVDNVRFSQPAIAWNPVSNTYGVVVVRSDDNSTALEFFRVNRWGAQLGTPVTLNPTYTVGKSPIPDIVAIPGQDHWGISYRTNANMVSALIITNDGTSLGSSPVPSGNEVATTGITFHPGFSRLMTVRDQTDVPWSPKMTATLFNAQLLPWQSNIDIVENEDPDYFGRYPASIALPGFDDTKDTAFIALDYREPELTELRHYLCLQRIDMNNDAAEVAWPKDEANMAHFAGKIAVKAPTTNVAFLNAIAWNPKNKNVGVAYSLEPDKAPATATTDVYFTIVDPDQGTANLDLLLYPLNGTAPGKALPQMPEIAWDGEEFLVAWNEAPEAGGPTQVRLSKFNGTGKRLGAGEEVLKPIYADIHNRIPGWSGKSMVGHDGIHVLVGEQQAHAAADSTVWMYIEPPYAK